MDIERVDLLALIGPDTQLKNKGHGEYAGPCPFCGGKDRFIVWPKPDNGKPRYWCRQCNRTGDAISYIQQRDQLDFRSACERLGLQLDALPLTRSNRPAQPPRPDSRLVDRGWAAMTPAWQRGAESFCAAAWETLHSDAGAPGWEYLKKRGLRLGTVAAFDLGWNLAPYHAEWGDIQIYLPAGLVIPWRLDAKYWTIDVRRLDGKQPKYRKPRGSANGLYIAGAIRPQSTVVIVEGEIDALTIWQETRGLPVVAVATGSTQGAHLHRWIARLAAARRHVIAFDIDENGAGQNAAKWWQGIFPDAIRLSPTAHDVNDMLTGGENVRQWIGSIA